MSLMHFVRLFLFIAVAMGMLFAGIVEAREPTEMEQFYLELVNRTRADPGAEVTRLSGFTWGDDPSLIPDTEFPESQTPDLNEGLAPGTILNTFKQPLAFNTQLIDAASDYADLLLQDEAFSHTHNTTTSVGRIEDTGFTFDAPAGSGENLALTTSSGAHPLDASRVEQHHRGLFIDGNVTGRGHRTNILNDPWMQIGLAIRVDSDTDSFFGPPFMSDVLSVQEFVFESGDAFVTGVAYNDVVDDDFFTPDSGESIANLTVEAWQEDTMVGSIAAFGTGGYSLQLSPGTYDIRFVKPGGLYALAGMVTMGSENLKLDLIDAAFIPEPGVYAGIFGLVGLFLAVRRRKQMA